MYQIAIPTVFAPSTVAVIVDLIIIAIIILNSPQPQRARVCSLSCPGS